MARIDEALRGVNEEAARRFLDWTQPELDGWKPPTEVPPGLRFGALRRRPRASSPTASRATRGSSRCRPTSSCRPSCRSRFRARCSIKAADAGKDEAITLLQSLMLRFLTSIPPGKVRFTIVDPVGLGENFAAFMHLADYDELLVTNRIWTEPPHIEQRLTDLTEHMENVIQKYLRNEFETIEEYNTMAGEVAEPFRILVVANFPTNFNDDGAAPAGQHRQQRRALRRLRPGRCSTPKLGCRRASSSRTSRTHCVNLIWKDGRLDWREPNFGRYPLALDAPPDPARFSEILHKVGAAARDANRVEVPFEFIAPKPDAVLDRRQPARASTSRWAAPAPPSCST